MRLNFESNHTQEEIGFVAGETAALAVDELSFSDALPSGDFPKKLRAGVEAIREGKNGDARKLLFQAAEIEPQNEEVWLRLASVSEYPEELLVFLNNALQINPENRSAREWEKATENLLAEKFSTRAESENEQSEPQRFSRFNFGEETALNRSAETAKNAEQLLEKAAAEVFAGDLNAAEDTLDDVLAYAPKNEEAWLLKAFLTDSFAEKAECWEAVLAINPENELARASTNFLGFLESKLTAAFRENDKTNRSDTEADESFGNADDVENMVDLSDIYVTYSAAANYTDEEMLDSDESKISESAVGKNVLPAYYEIEDVSSEMNAPAQSDYLSSTENKAATMKTNRFEPRKKDVDAEKVSDIVPCPFCLRENEPQTFVCPSCLAVLTLSDLEMLLAHADANREIVRQAVERLEAEKDFSALNSDELKVLAVGQINLKHLRQGFKYLQEAARLNPNDVVLSSQVNALAIRLNEIEAQENIHSSMPKNKTILVVDDSATVRTLISSKLEKAGHSVLCAVDGVDALEQIEAAVPDLILLDITMPRMDGYTVCKMIRTNERTKDIPVVMISGKDGFFDKVRGRIAGTTGYITKPFGPETLMKTIESYIV